MVKAKASEVAIVAAARTLTPFHLDEFQFTVSASLLLSNVILVFVVRILAFVLVRAKFGLSANKLFVANFAGWYMLYILRVATWPRDGYDILHNHI